MARRAGPGRPRKSVEAKVLAGTYRKDRDGPLGAGDAPEPPPAPPAGLTVEQSAAWGELIPTLAGRVKRSDVLTLVDLCRWVVRMKRIDERLAKMAVEDKGDVQTLTAAGIATTNFDRLASKFGMSPSDRAKLRVADAGPPAPKVRTRPATKLDQ